MAHIRYASTAAVEAKNTTSLCTARPPLRSQRRDPVGRLEAELGSARPLFTSDTDSERFFALITKNAEAKGGDHDRTRAVGSSLSGDA